MLTIDKPLTESEVASLKERWAEMMTGDDVIVWSGFPGKGLVELRNADGNGGIIVAADFAAGLLAPMETEA